MIIMISMMIRPVSARAGAARALAGVTTISLICSLIVSLICNNNNSIIIIMIAIGLSITIIPTI